MQRIKTPYHQELYEQMTSHQKEVVNKVLEDVLKGRSRGLYGSAGVGKTFCMNYLVNYLKSLGNSVLVTAPTHKALQVLRGKVDHTDDGFKTIHSFLGLKQYYYKDKVYFKATWGFQPQYFDYVVIDEASMVNKELVDLIEKWEEEKNITFIIVGDKKQLPPVGEIESLLLDYKGYELTEIVRQKKGSSIIDLSRNLNWLFKLKDTKEYRFIKEIDYERLATEGHGDDCKFISWRNIFVDQVGKKVRGLLYSDEEDYAIGESLYFTNAVEGFHNNQEVIVDFIRKETMFKENHELEYYVLGFQGHTAQTRVIKNSSLKNYKEYTNELKKACENKIVHWSEFYDWIESWSTLKTNYSLTVHRSQGSTYKHTIINLGDILCNPNEDEREKMLYTAVTRASDSIDFIINK